MQAHEITPEFVARRLVEAVEVLKRLRQKGHRPQYPTSKWPSVIHDYWDAYGQSEAYARPVPPSADEIDRMDEVIFDWLPRLGWQAIDRKQFVAWQRILWARADGRSFEIIARMLKSNGINFSKDTVRRRHQELLERIVSAIIS